MKTFFSHIWQNRRTTALGVAGLIGVGLQAYTNPASLANPETVLQAISSVGLIVAADPKKKTDGGETK
jgi:hypothetical protein